ncbi:U3 snoRNP protein [Pleurotus pulmonarius]|nr:U3 snoRNP protein [Pleurotus pulmonarius]
MYVCIFARVPSFVRVEPFAPNFAQFSLAFSPADGTRICKWAWREPHIRVWDLSTGRLLLELKGHTLRVASVAFSPDSTQILSVSNDKTIRIWDSADGHQVRKLDMNRPAAVPPLQGQRLLSPEGGAVTFSGDGLVCVYGAVNFQKTVTQWDTTSGKVISQSEVPYNQTAPGQPEDPLLEAEDTWIVPAGEMGEKGRQLGGSATRDATERKWRVK